MPPVERPAPLPFVHLHLAPLPLSSEIRTMSADAAELQLKKAEPISAHTEAAYRPQVKVVWYRSSFFAAIILGLCNFCAPGLWGAMNSVGAGGEETPWLANAANAETFSLMVLTVSSIASTQMNRLFSC